MIALAASHLLTFLVFMLIAWATPTRGWRLFLALFALGVGIGAFNLMIEALAFAVISPAQAAQATIIQATTFAALAAVATLLAPSAPSTAAQMRLDPLRLIGVVAAYLVLYISAGMLVFPFVAAFYADLHVPDIRQVLALQAARACVFVASSVLLLRGGLRYAPFVLGVAFSVIGGLAPLLPENPLMPPEVRGPHAIEVGISNFLFGAFTGWLLTHKQAPTPAAA